MAHGVRAVLVEEVAWQVAALRAGFAAAVDGSHLLALQLSGEELAEAL